MQNVIVSLTTIKSRLYNLPIVLSSILTKNTSLFTIHIFISNDGNIYDDGCNKEDLIDLNKFIYENNNSNSNVKILISETQNIGPYRKLIPALKLYKNHIIITMDDDESFESNLVDKFLKAYEEHKCIICSVARIVDITNWANMNDAIDNYKKLFVTDSSYMNLLPEGCGGILYHSNMFNDDFIDFDYKLLDDLTIKNDDIFFRFYTYHLNIPIFVIPIYQRNIYNTNQTCTLFNTNQNQKMNDIFEKIQKYQLIFRNSPANNYDNNTDIYNLINLHKNQIDKTYKKYVHTGTDVKKLQYRIKKEQKNDIVFDLNNIIQNTFFNGDTTDINAILINIEKDKIRYESAIEEFKKFSITNFVHLKATYWKNTFDFVNDMNGVLFFLRKYNKNIPSDVLKMNIFSDFNDKNILIQDGPLACYCSHTRAIIYGYLNFKNYTMIVEDDFYINDINAIIENLNKIPNDWDIICFGAQPINKFYDGSFYKFSDMFHSTQFYVIKNSSIETIFKYIYPIIDQIDILLSKAHDNLNIYNIPDCILQKNYDSNTQNNLYVIYNSPNYEFIRKCIENVKQLLINIFCAELNITKNEHMQNIILKILYDVIFNAIVNIKTVEKIIINKTKQYENYFFYDNKKKLHVEISVIMDACIKGMNIDTLVDNLIDDIYYIIKCFALSDTIDELYNEKLISLNYGSTSNVYLLENNNKVVKIYNKSLRWKCDGHDDNLEIIKNEINILHKLNRTIVHCENKIYCDYLGESLFDNFYLPTDWIEQLTNIFTMFTEHNIFYPEFNLKNIVCQNDKLNIIDFGLAKIDNLGNGSNLNNFIELLTLINDKFKNIANIEHRYVYYNNLINNIKMSNDTKYKTNIY